MAKIVKKQKKNRISSHHPEAKGSLFIIVSFLLFLALVSFVDGHRELNWLGIIGYITSYSLYYIFGLCSYFVAIFLIWIGWRMIRVENYNYVSIKIFYFAIFISSSSILLNLIAETKWIDFSFLYDRIYSESAIIYSPTPVRYIRYNLGGAPFYYIYRDLPHLNLQNLLSDTGIGITFSIISLITFILLTDSSLFKSAQTFSKIGPFTYKFTLEFLRGVLKIIHKYGPKPTLKHDAIEVAVKIAKKVASPVYVNNQEKPESTINFVQLPIKESTKNKIAIEKFFEKIEKKEDNKTYQLPPVNLLSNAKLVDQTGVKKELKQQASILEETLLSFGIDGKVGNIYSGPTVTLFEVHPAIGVKVQKIKTLENDIALNLEAKSIRIIAPIPGKAAVGVEIPSLSPQEVGFKEMLITYCRTHKGMRIPMLLGKAVSGEEVVCDLTKMPHCIIAGATGSGKSVCINAIIMSILMNLGPDDVKLILIDPKKVELTPFSDLPHLIAPVITEAPDAYGALQWIVREMQYRYELFKRIGVRNITSFNNRKIDSEFESGLEMPIPEKLYFIVCIIDEFADLMMTSSTDLETPIARIAQMARAVGIHLILATQRPSREVITGLIKANFPTRIAFKVSSRINSQIILDENGAEALLGNGDMLFLPPGTSQLIRCQGVFIRDEDINKVVEHIKATTPTNYLFNSFESSSDTNLNDSVNNDHKDQLYEKALQTVISHQTASTTFLQRKLKIGYARAASLIDELEQNDVIGPPDGSRPRKIL